MADDNVNHCGGSEAELKNRSKLLKALSGLIASYNLQTRSRSILLIHFRICLSDPTWRESGRMDCSAVSTTAALAW